MRKIKSLLIIVSIIILSYNIRLSKNDDYHDSTETSAINSGQNSIKEKSIPYTYQGSLLLNNLYGERTVDIYVKIFEKDHKISQILLKLYNHRGTINFLAYAPQIEFPKYPDKPYPLCGLIICLPSELGMSGPELLKVFPPQNPNTWREYIFHYNPGKCTERPQKFPSISDILSGKAKLCIRVDGHRFTIDNLEKLPQK